MRSFLESRGHRARRRPRGRPSSADRKNELVLQLIHEQGVEVYEGSVRYVRGGARRRAAPRGRLLERQHRARCCTSTGHRATCSRRVVDGRDDRARGPARQARARHVPRRGARRSASSPAQAAVFEDALAGVEAGRAGRLRLRRRRRPRRARRRAARARRRRRRRRTSPSCSGDRAPPIRRAEPVGDPRDARSTSTCCAQTRVGVRALQRPHRPARQPRRGRAARPARHLPQRRSTRLARCRTPRPATATPRTARRSSTSPTAS